MAVFCVLLFVPIMMQHLVVNQNNIDYEKKNKRAMTVFFIILTILVMLRHQTVGTDTRRYVHYFKRFLEMDWTKLGKDYIEIGFAYYSKIISLFSENPQFFLAITAVIICLLIYFTYIRFCGDPSLTIVLFCTMSTFVMMFSGLKQMMAIGIGFIAYELTRRKKLVFFVLVVCLALTFHTSAFILAFMYPLYHIKITKKWLLVVVPSIIVVFIFNKQIFSILSIIIERYTQYDASVTRTGAYTMIFLFAIFAVFSFLIPDESLLDQETIGLRNFLLFALVLQMFAPLHTIAMRMNYYYIIFIPLLIPKIISARSEKWQQVAVLSRHLMLVFFLAYFFITASSGGGLRVFPYHFFWESV